MAEAVKKVKLDPIFVWQGKDKKGSRAKGEISANNVNTAKALLRRQGITPIKIKKKPKDLFAPRKAC